jgi:hypothetical protein
MNIGYDQKRWSGQTSVIIVIVTHLESRDAPVLGARLSLPLPIDTNLIGP